MERDKAALRHRVYTQCEAWHPPLIDVKHLVVVPSSLRRNDFAMTLITKMPARTQVRGQNRYFCDGYHGLGVKREADSHCEMCCGRSCLTVPPTLQIRNA